MSPLGSSTSKFTIIGILIACFGVITPILWDLYKSRSILELTLNNATTIVSKTPGLEKLEIKYGNEIVSRISKVTFTLANKGRKPITKTEIIQPPSIVFSNASKLLDVNIDNKVPKELIATIIPNLSNNSITIDFPLLNSADEITFSALFSGEKPEFQSTCRIYGLKKISIADKTHGGQKVTWEFYVVLTFCALALFGLFPVAIEYWGAIQTLRRTNLDIKKLMLFNSKDEFIDYVNNIYYFFPYKTEIAIKVRGIIASKIEDIRVKAIETIIGQINQVIRINRMALYVILALLSISIWYLITKLY